MKWLDTTLVYSPIKYGLCKDKESFKKQLKKLKVDVSYADEFIIEGSHATAHTFTKESDVCMIVCIGEGCSVIEAHALLAHEAVHIWQEIKETIGETNPSHEFEAYSIQNIVQNLIEAYDE